MGNTKDTKKTGSPTPMSDQPDREFEGQGKNPTPGKGTPGQQAGGSKKDFEDDDMTTSGGREGKFSDTGSPSQGQWSPGSSHESDR